MDITHHHKVFLKYFFVFVFDIGKQQQHNKRKYIKKYNVASRRPHLQITNKSLTQKFDKQVQCGKQVNQISVTSNSIISKQLCKKQKTSSKFNMIANMAAKSHYTDFCTHSRSLAILYCMSQPVFHGE